MFRRMLAVLLALTLGLGLVCVRAESSPDASPDNRALFLEALSQRLETLDPSSQEITLFLKPYMETLSLVLQPAGQGVRLSAKTGEKVEMALEAGPEALWILYQGQVVEVPFHLLEALSDPVRHPDALLAEFPLEKYLPVFEAWAAKALTLFGPLVRVTQATPPFTVHISADARQLITALSGLVDEITSDRETMDALLRDLAPLLTALGAEADLLPEMEAETLLDAWQTARRQLLSQAPDFSLTLDVTVDPQSRLYTLSGTVYAGQRQACLDALLRPGNTLNTYTLTASLYGSLLDGGRLDLNMNKALDGYPAQASAGRVQTYQVTGTLDFSSPYGTQSRIQLDMTESSSLGRYFAETFAGTVKVFSNARTLGSADFSLILGSDALTCHATLQDENGTLDARLYGHEGGADLRLSTSDAVCALAVTLKDGVPVYARFALTDTDYEEVTELTYEGGHLALRDSEQEILIRAEYPAPDHLSIPMTRTELSSDLPPRTAYFDVLLPAGEDDVLVKITATDVDGQEALQGGLTAVPASPAASLGETEFRLVLDRETLLRLFSDVLPDGALPTEGLPDPDGPSSGWTPPVE